MSYSMSLNFNQRQTQSLKQTQRLIMSPQMQQAINLLQLPLMELATAIDTELSQNPILEYSSETEDEMGRVRELEQETAEVELDANSNAESEMSFDDKDFEIMKHLDEQFQDHFSQSENYSVKRSQDEEKLKSYLEASVTSTHSLFEHLMEQARQTFEEAEDLRAAELLIGNLDERGFLETPIEEIALLNDLDTQILYEVLDEIQRFEPHGVGAANLQESLLIQLRCQGKRRSLAYELIEKHYEDLLHNRIPLIQKSLGRSAQEIREAVESAISKLDLQPGAWYASAVVQEITPDISVREDLGELSIHVNDDRLPSIRINSRYLRMLEKDDLPEETREYVKQKVMSGKWLLRNIHQRNDTLYRITEYLITHQRDFFRLADGKLKPMTMKQVAEALELHESTVARAVAGKYMDCPQGVVALRSFFTNSYVTSEGKDISSKTVKDVLLEIVEKENKSKPLSDEAISNMIKERGINCARRTVAKYRRELHIGNASQRRSYA